MTTTPRELTEGIREATSGLPLSGLIVFGSRARGAEHPGSDLDVGILPCDDSVDRRRLQAQLAARLSDLVPGDRVDVVYLDEAPELLRQRAFETGRLVFCREPERWKTLRIATMREHADRAWARRLLRQGQRRRLSEGRTDGRSGRALRSLERARGLPR